MKLDPKLNRTQLQALSNKALLQELLANTPLNLPRVFLLALLYILMPCAVLGSRLGVLGTAVMAAVAAYLWLWGAPAELDSYLVFWLVWSCVDLLIVLLVQLVGGLRQYRAKKQYLPAEDRDSVDLRPGESMEWQPAENPSREIVARVPEQGVYVLVCRVDDCPDSVMLQADARACIEEQETVPGLRTELRAAFRLEAGSHRLQVKAQVPESFHVDLFLR